MEDYTVVVEGEVVKKAGKTAIDRFCENAKGKLLLPGTLIHMLHKKYNHHACCKR